MTKMQVLALSVVPINSVALIRMNHGLICSPSSSSSSSYPSSSLSPSQIPEEMSRCRNSYVEQALLPRHLEDLAGGDAEGGGYRSLLQDSLDALLKEAKDKFKGYDSCSTPEHVELACRKVRVLAASSLTHGACFRERIFFICGTQDQQSVCPEHGNELTFIKHTPSCHPSSFPVSGYSSRRPKISKFQMEKPALWTSCFHNACETRLAPGF